MLHCVRMGTHAEKKIIKEFKDTFTTLIINANIVAHTLDSMAAFLGVELKKSFIIDPQTYAFQNRGLLLSDSEKSGGRLLKSSIEKLISKYGDGLKKIIMEEGRSLQAADFQGQRGDVFLKDLCTNVIRFQQEEIKSSLLNNQEYGEYMQFINNRNGRIAENPKTIIPPYFYMQTATLNDWLPINVNSIKEAINILGNAAVSAQIVINQDILMDKNSVERIVSAYSQLNIESILIWVDALNESDVPAPILYGFADLLKRFKQTGKKIYNLYGGYFSILLTKEKKLLDGVCNGMEYGEHRAVFPVGGGLPRAKFYLPSTHSRLSYRTALSTLDDKGYLSNDKYYSNVCNCPTCNELLQNNPKANFEKYGKSEAATFERKTKSGGRLMTVSFPTTTTKENCLRHYLHVKEEEFKLVDEKDISHLSSSLENAYNEYVPNLGTSIIYLKTWKSIFDSI